MPLIQRATTTNMNRGKVQLYENAAQRMWTKITSGQVAADAINVQLTNS